MNRVLFPALLAAAGLSGCAGASAAYLAVPALRVAERKTAQVDDFSIEEAFQRQEQLVFPMKVAVIGLERNPGGLFEDVESSALERLLLDERTLFHDVVPLFDYLEIGSDRLVEAAPLRRAAARAHADVILFYDQRLTIEERFNAAALLNLTGLGAFLFNGTTYEMTLDTRVRLMDVRNGVLYTTFRDVRTHFEKTPTALASENARDAKKRLRGEAFGAVRNALKGKLEARRTGGPPGGA